MLLDVVGLYDGGRAGEGLLGCGSEGDYDRVIEQGGVGSEAYVYGCASIDGNLLVDIAHACKDERSV